MIYMISALFAQAEKAKMGAWIARTIIIICNYNFRKLSYQLRTLRARSRSVTERNIRPLYHTVDLGWNMKLLLK